MFKNNSKKTQVLPHWSLQVLTQDYLLTGEFKFNNEFVSATEILEDFLRLIGTQVTAAHGSLGFTLTAAHLQPTGQYVTPAQTFSELTVDMRTVVAFIPDNEECTSALKQQFEKFKYPFAASFMAGPYLIRGTLLSNYAAITWDTTAFFPVAQASLACQLPGAKLTGLQVPWLLLNGATVQAGGQAL